MYSLVFYLTSKIATNFVDLIKKRHWVAMNYHNIINPDII